MIHISNTSTRDLDKLALEHYASFKASITRRVNLLKRDKWLRVFLEENAEKIITGKPKELYDLNRKFNKLMKINGKRLSQVRPRLNQVFNYTAFVRDKKKSYSFAQSLNINCCPYCNRNYTVTVVDKGKRQIIRPDFDHFFPKSKFPLFALSFFNLIPSCPLCNRSIKNSQDLVYGKYIHPYEEEFADTLRFNYKPLNVDSSVGIKKDYEIHPIIEKKDPKKAQRCINNFRIFKIREIYEISHVDEISDLVRKYHTSGGRYIEILHKNLPALGSIEDLYKIAFGNFYNTDDFSNRPLSKMTKDIVDQLKFTMPIVPNK